MTAAFLLVLSKSKATSLRKAIGLSSRFFSAASSTAKTTEPSRCNCSTLSDASSPRRCPVNGGVDAVERERRHGPGILFPFSWVAIPALRFALANYERIKGNASRGSTAGWPGTPPWKSNSKRSRRASSRWRSRTMICWPPAPSSARTELAS